ncbi:MAG TPA: hypothetical protein VJ853_03830 [Thermoanaerobaculia bacterium]|nr:hypothetical protein [Thermoanaerobaculia bacterium]
MARRATKRPLKAAKDALKRTTKKLTSRLHHKKESVAAAAPTPRKRAPAKAARPARRPADIPLDVLNRTYTPHQTSLKSSFRTSGGDRQRDQEFAGGFADERFNDEDRVTNKSGDPRIGTHRRKYEPGE